MLPPGRRPDAAPSAGLTGSRHPTGTANRTPCCALHSLRRRRVCRVGMSPLSGPSPPTTLDSPGLKAPLRKARSQNSAACPHRLRHASELSLRAICESAANRLRQSCHRDHGPVALPCPRVPACRSRFPAAFARARPPPPAVSLRSRSAIARTCRRPRPQPHSAILKSQHLPLFLPIHSGRTEKKECADAHLVYCHPWSLSPLKGRARCFSSARGSRAGERLEKKAGGVAPKTPFIARAIAAAASLFVLQTLLQMLTSVLVCRPSL